MKLRGLLFLFLALAAQAGAKVYYINKGVLYHIGDDRFSTSTDPDFMGAYPVVGQQWIQAFKVDQADRVKVSIGVVRGVDDCEYCRDLVSIDDSLMGRIYHHDNGVGFQTLDPLARRVEPGKIYYLRIESVGLQADDFVVGDVSVESDRAGITFLDPGPVLKNPGDPMPKVYPPAPRARASSPCDSLPVNHNWMLGWKNGAAAALALDEASHFKPSDPVVELKPGQAVELDFTAKESALKDAVSQAFECLAGEAPYSGWALLFGSAGKLEHGNLLLEGDYTPQRLHPAGYSPGQSNRLRVERCMDGSLHALLNGRDLGPGFKVAGEAVPIAFRAQGLQMVIKSATAPEAEEPQGLPAAP